VHGRDTIASMADQNESSETADEQLAFAPVTPSKGGHLSWTDPSGKHVVPLGDDKMVIGSAEQVDIRVTERTVSRLHAELTLEPSGLWVRDLGSKNGTFLDGILVRHARLPRKCKLRLGSCELTLSEGDAAEPSPLWQGDSFGPLVGRSAPMRRLFATLSRVAQTESSVLIHGATGTGKELVASALHNASHRAGEPFVVVDCAAIPENLLESQLFGHTKGSFTGAAGARIGDIEAADGGTVFLDEIGELPLAMQPKLLRVLESRTVRPVGATEARKVDVRFVSATHRDLRRMVNAGAFREDLYFRISVVPVTIPSLKDRIEDLPLLIERFLPPGAPKVIGAELLAELSTRPWLGNVRELRNFVERALSLGAQEALTMPYDAAVMSARAPASRTPTAAAAAPTPASSAVRFDQPFKTFREEWIDQGECEYVRRLLEEYKRDVPAVAQAAGLNRTYVYRLIKKHGI
jgi:transcriptional regulator with PAS, ATPase and Fis domain